MRPSNAPDLGKFILDQYEESTAEIENGAVLVIRGQHKGRVGFYCLQNEQTYDMRNLADCPDCALTIEGTPISAALYLDIEVGAYCLTHRRALIEHDLAVVYWDRPYGDDYSLVHPSELVPIPSTEYSRYERECQMDVKEALFRLREALGKI